jgi:glucose/mannose transport system permease protein
MSTSALEQDRLATEVAAPKRRRRGISEQAQSFLLLLPSFVAIAIFVYIFIAISFYVSLSNWRTLKIDLSLRQPLFQTYADLFNSPRFQADLRNTFVFTVVFLSLAVILGMLLAIFHRQLPGSSIYRNIFLFPYALSFVVTGVAWRWIFNPLTGINVLFNVIGINTLLNNLGMQPLKPGWITDPAVWLPINNIIATVYPPAATMQLKLGVPAAMIPVAIAATWQLSGFVMAMYVGGMATISEEVREAARIDGANEWQVYRHVIIPMLKPVTISLVVLLLHTSLKIFDLVFTMSGVGPGFATDVPAIFVFETMFKATRYNLATAAAIFMLVLVGLVVIPYLMYSLREEK